MRSPAPNHPPRLLLILALFVQLQAPPSALSQTITKFESRVTEVQVEAEVITDDGSIVQGLTKSDFRIFDEGAEQPVRTLVADDQPLDVFLVFDTSGSMRRHVEEVASAASQAFAELRQNDRVALMVFNQRSTLVRPLNSDLNVIEAGIQDILKRRFWGGTAIDRAVFDACKYYLRQGRSTRRRAILVITDDGGLTTKREQAVLRSLWEANAIVSAIITTTTKQLRRRDRVNKVAPYLLLKRIVGVDPFVEKTGGDLILEEAGGSQLAQAIKKLRSRYTLFYLQPTARPGEVRNIRVELSPETLTRNPGLHVVARKSYLVSK